MMTFQNITEENYKECLNLKVGKSQTDFVGSNATSLAKAYVFKELVTPLAIYEEDIMIGFLLLRHTQNPENCFLWEFMIDEQHQSKGYGKQALHLLIEWVKANTASHSLTTTYKWGNVWAEQLYKKAGFEFLDSSEAYQEEDLILYLNSSGGI